MKTRESFLAVLKLLVVSTMSSVQLSTVCAAATGGSDNSSNTNPKCLEPFESADGNDTAEAYRELLSLPEHVVGEIIDGKLRIQSPPLGRHNYLFMSLAAQLGACSDSSSCESGGWVILPQSEIHFGSLRNVFRPDFAGWRRNRFPKDLIDQFSTSVIPDWICEIVSDDTEEIDRTIKMKIYAKYGVRHYWIINPEPSKRSLEIYSLASIDQSQWRQVSTTSGSGKVLAPPFELIEIDLGQLWFQLTKN